MTTRKPKPKRGGARKGAGRKPGRKYVAVTVLLRPDQVASLRLAGGINKAVRAAVDAYPMPRALSRSEAAAFSGAARDAAALRAEADGDWEFRARPKASE